MSTAPRVCVVGAGPAGMAMARSLASQGLAFDCFERHSDVGGIWDQANRGSPVYDSAHFISSKTQSHFHDFPMPEAYPDYPSHRQILAYMHAFADAYGIRPAIRFGLGVAATERTTDGWLVTTDDGEARHYHALVCATGTNWHPSMPDIPGSFSGSLRHSQSYRSHTEFAGKRVLVIGAGNSGVDIACDAAVSADHAAISLRRGYHFIPKHIFGMPSDVFAEQGPSLPKWLEQRVFGGMLRVLNGDVTRLGLPAPDHRVFESHPIMNTQLLHHLAHGDVHARPDVVRLHGDQVTFQDGTTEPFDEVICATGYRWAIPYVDRACFDWKGGRPDLYMSLFHRTDPTLYAVGFMETNGGAYKLFDEMADLVTRTIAARSEGGRTAKRVNQLVSTDTPDLSGGIRFVGSDRHATYVENHAYQSHIARIRRRLGWPSLTPGMFEPLRTATSSLKAVPA